MLIDWNWTLNTPGFPVTSDGAPDPSSPACKGLSFHAH
jgi:hypothetical protein